MPRPFSSSQLERLGGRLVVSRPPAADDIAQLQVLLAAYSPVVDRLTKRIRDAAGLVPSSRVKNTGTILEKLERQGGSWLKTVHDLGGLRLADCKSRDEQNTLVRQLVALFDDGARGPRVIDRRETPVQGYRAVHVIVYPDGFPVEIQVRTRRQHEWAELFEKLADIFGRGIRYGESPVHWTLSASRPTGVPADSWADVQALPDELVRLALVLSTLIEAVEIAQQRGAGVLALNGSLDAALASLAKVTEAFARIPLRD